MSWLQNENGKTLGEIQAAYQPHNTGYPNLHALPNQWADAIKAIAPAVMQYLKQRKNDQIANSIMNMEQPPRAEAIGYPQGAPATMPQSGGTDQLAALTAFRKYQDEQQAGDQEGRLNEARILALQNRGTGNTIGKYPVQLPDGTTAYVTGNAALRHADQGNKPKKTDYSDVKQQTGHDWAEWNQLAENDLKNIETDPSDPTRLRGYFPKGPVSKEGTQAMEPASISVQMFRDAQDRMKKKVTPSTFLPTSDSGVPERFQRPAGESITAPTPEDAGASSKTSGGQKGYIPGRRYAGKQYIGGDPNDPNNWSQ